MKTLAGIAVMLLVGLTGCGPAPQETFQGRVVGVEHETWRALASVVLEYDDGNLKVLNPICSNTSIPVSVGMRASVTYSWHGWNECYTIDASRELK